MLLDSRTRPIHQILEEYLPPEVLAYALRLWSQEYVQQQNISMLSFVDAFYHRQPLPYSRQHIYSSLLPALMEVIGIRENFDESTTDLYEYPDYDLPGGGASASTPLTNTAPAPIPKADTPPVQPVAAPPPVAAPVPPAAPPEPPPRPEPARNERFEAFSTFVRKLMRSLSEERRKKMLFYNRKSFIKAVPESIAHSFYGWLQTNNDYFEHPDLDTESMSNVVHQIYAGLCNYLGPLEADQVLMKAANVVDDKFSRDALDIRELL